MTGVNLLGVCEAFAFAQKAGLDLTAVHGALTGGAANSWALDVLGKVTYSNLFIFSHSFFSAFWKTTTTRPSW
jgi:3-hydroxyisobutyrate dehydrogenase-like beta-hydroxyacid dehydrogenase